MFIYVVSPILEYSPLFELNYFSRFSFEIGNIIEISIQNKKIRAVIIDKKDLRESKDKTEVRKAGFQLKKIEDENIYGNVNENIFYKIDKFAKENLASFGEVFYKLYGNSILGRIVAEVDKLEKNKINIQTLETSTGLAFEKYLECIIQNNKRGEDKKTKSFFVFSEEIPFKLFKNFLKEKEKISESLSKKNTRKMYNVNIYKINDFIKNINNLDLENVNIFLHNFDFKNYSSYQKPYLNNINLFFLYLDILNIKVNLYLQNSFFGVCERFFIENKGLEIWQSQISSPEKIKKILVKDKFTKIENQNDVISKTIFEKIKQNVSQNKKSFIFVLSHGYADRVYCEECNFSVKCSKCKSEFSLIQNEEERILLCKSCKHEEILNINKNLRCENCGSYNLKDFGIGIQKIYEILEKEFPDKNIQIDESQKKLTEIQIQKSIKNFFEENDLNLIGSNRTTKSILEKVDTVFVLSLGSLTTSKTFYFDEEILKNLSILEGVSNEIYIQQNSENEEVWERYKKKGIYFQAEIENRKITKLPPFSKIVNFSLDYKNRKVLDGLSFKEDILGLNFKKGRVSFYIIKENPENVLEEIKKNRNIFDIKISNIIENSNFWK